MPRKTAVELVEARSDVAQLCVLRGGRVLQLGKEAITVRHVLQHRPGITTAGGAFGDALVMADWARSVHRAGSRGVLRHAGAGRARPAPRSGG
ncbi:hypothetical protein LWP59_07620 [Amycolatopsis acidiphila]|uniref:hypothetical protein n=1 Tax=Amycolatopsis acidiphila TaxID=715473 RepID=UPI001643D2AD|nr:hypothetical protein [Amycolatopsis acidiphila]UIJ61483.1 hypothetical protein LWP59_07620 [Amycolatopsis acidiphila]GHG59659.1 hypothetical protein GCM10017788_13290 [Amycolatopsis acidiphila]